MSVYDEITAEAEIIKSNSHRKRRGLLCYDRTSKQYYINVPLSFDIETSSFYENDEKRAILVCYGMNLFGEFKFGRTWQDFISELCMLNAFVEGLNVNARAILFVHNLGYEFQFIAQHLLNIADITELLSSDTRKPIKFNWQRLEFRCSYILSGYSLEKVGDNLGFPKSKDWDYSLQRNSLTELTEDEIFYQQRDCDIVVKFVQGEIDRYNGRITEIPLTNTGNVRKEIQKYARGDRDFKQAISHLTLRANEYQMLKSAFMGGFTHASPHHIGKKLSNVASYDFTSSYPAVMLTEKFPNAYAKHEDNITLEELDSYIKKGYLSVFTATFKGLKAREGVPDYYISLHKSKTHYARENETTSRIKVDNVDNMRVFNGRIQYVNGYIKINLTSIDFDIIRHVYTFERVAISNCYLYFADYLPQVYFRCILDLYMKKCVLKGIPEKEDEYMHAKGMLNSMYGMTVEDVVKDNITFDCSGWSVQSHTLFTEDECVDQIDKYNAKKKRITAYHWGIFITAYARRNLWSGIMEFGRDYVYSDTDSIKAINADKHKQYIDGYNRMITKKLQKAFKTRGIDTRFIDDPKYKPIGVWDYEGTYKAFKTLGAKRYLTEDDNGNLHLTCAGVRKEAVTAIHSFDDFKDGLHFDNDATGKMQHSYIDSEFWGVHTDYQGNTADYHELSAVHLENTDFTITIERVVQETIRENINGKN